MSDSDDTDLLLLIPPNFFSIDSDDIDSSDCELSLCKGFKFKPKYKKEKKLVSDLLNNVSELATRISALEDIEGTRHSFDSENFNSSLDASKTMNSRRGSIDSLTHRSLKSSGFTNKSPSKLDQPQSLPSTPDVNRFRRVYSESPKSHSLTVSPSKSDLSYSKHDSKSLTASGNLSKNDLYHTFKSNAKFPDNASSQKSVCYIENDHSNFTNNPSFNSQTATNNQMTYFQSLDSNSHYSQNYLESKSKPITNAYFGQNPSKQLDLPEVDRLLREMEITQEEIENKLKSKEDLLNIQCNSRSSNTTSFSNYGVYPLDLAGKYNCPVDPKSPSLKTTDVAKKEDSHSAQSSATKNSNCARRLEFGSNLNLSKMSSIQPSQIEKESIQDNVIKSTISKSNSSSSLPQSTFQNSKLENLGTNFVNHNLPRTSSQTSILNDLKELDKKTQEIVENSVAHTIQINSNLRELNPTFNYSSNSQSADDYENIKRLKQKLEEENQRRQHCENLVIDLQQEVLEWRERLAVAVAVDAEKNRAIGKLETTWRKTVDHWRQLEEQRHSLAVALQTLKEERRSEMVEMTEKLRRHELEVSQALDLAAGYKMKADSAEKERATFMAVAEKKNYELETNLKNLEETHKNILMKLKEREDEAQVLQEKLQLAEQNYSEILSEDRLENYLNFVKQSEHQLLQEACERLSQSEMELASVIKERDDLNQKLKEENLHVQVLQKQKKDLLLALDESKENEKQALENIKHVQSDQEKLKKDLRVFYQKQLESVVRDKLKEFQNQLDSAEAGLKAELHARERALAELAARQMQILNEKNKLELDKLREQKQEHIKSLERTVLELRQALDVEKSKRAEMARELHNVMETQWRQALSIITSQKTDISRQELVNEKGEPALSVNGFDDGCPTYRIDNKIPPDQLQKYFQMFLEKAPVSKENLDKSLLHSSFFSEENLGSASQCGEVYDNLNYGSKFSSNNFDHGDSKTNPGSKGKPPWK